MNHDLQDIHHAAKMEAIGRCAASIAHDFNNTLAAILGHGDLAQHQLPPDSAVRRHIDEVVRAAVLGKGLVERILTFSRAESSPRAPVSVRSVVEAVLALLGPSVDRHVHLEKVFDASDVAVVGDATELHQAVMNLCTNALQALGDRGVITVSLARTELIESRAVSHGTLGAGAYAQIAVSDTGIGIPPAVRERIFEPFFTTNGNGKGTGLGLSLVHTIVAELGGAIDVTSEVGKGTTFTLWLPAAKDVAALATDEAEPLPRGHSQPVAVVDDDPTLVELGEEMLAALGYRPTGFCSGAAALEVLRADPRRFEGVLIDEVMPDLPGTALAREIRRLRPDIAILLMSGYSGPDLTARAKLSGVDVVLNKPLRRRDIAAPIAQLLAVRKPASCQASSVRLIEWNHGVVVASGAA